MAGAAALLGLLLLATRLEGASPAAYRGGLLLVALLSAVVVAAAVHPAARLGKALSMRPLVWLGTRSYAVYLWHWPVFTATRPDLDVDVHGWALLVLRLAATLVLAEGSTRLVAAVLRRASWQADVASRRRVVVAASSFVLLAIAVTGRAPEPTEVFFVSPTTALAATPSTATTTATVLALPPTTASVLPAPPPVAAPVPPSPPATVGPGGPPPRTTQVRAVAVGESVLMSAGGDVQRAIGDGTIVDADIARQPRDVLAALESRRATGYLYGVSSVIVQMGSNGALDAATLDRMAALVAGVPRVVAVTVHVDRPWAESSNAALRDAAARYPWLRLADWHAAASERPEWLASDGVHPTRAGSRAYAELVKAAVTAS